MNGHFGRPILSPMFPIPCVDVRIFGRSMLKFQVLFSHYRAVRCVKRLSQNSTAPAREAAIATSCHADAVICGIGQQRSIKWAGFRERRFEQTIGNSPALESVLAAVVRARGADRFHHPGPRRKRHGHGTDRSGDSQDPPTLWTPVNKAKLRRDSICPLKSDLFGYERVLSMSGSGQMNVN